MNFDPDYAEQLLGMLPSGTRVEFTTARGDLVTGEARDYPRPGRRFTVNGMWEWFATAEFLGEKVAAVKVEPFVVTVINT
jgi:hypothetical protein